MEILFQNVQVYSEGGLARQDVLVRGTEIAACGEGLAAPGAQLVQGAGCLLAPAFTDVHVHLRQPGYEQKETIASGTAAAAAGGYATVCAMPNLLPVPDSPGALAPQQAAIEKEALVRVLPYGAITMGEKGVQLADIAALAGSVCGFSDDGYGVQSEAVMRSAMQAVAAAGSFVAAHCEVDALLPQGGTCVQAGSSFALRGGYTGHSSESEWAEVQRDIRLAEETGCRLHICHASTAETFSLVRQAQRRGLPVSCEVTPHNLLLSCDDITEDDGCFKMNPPLRTRADVAAAVEALQDGTACAVATDHAPHTEADKAGGFAKSANGVIGLETAFAALYTNLVLRGTLPLQLLLRRFIEGPAALLGEAPGTVRPGAAANLTLLDLQAEHTVLPERFKTRGRATPFAGHRLRGWPVMTLYGGSVVYRRDNDI